MRLLEDSLAEEVLSGRIKDGDQALVDIDNNKKVTINISSEESPQELASANFQPFQVNMQSISPETIFRGYDAWQKSLPQIIKLT